MIILGDDTMKLWDLRQFKTPVNVVKDLFNLLPMTDCMFSPDDKILFTGVSMRKGEKSGKLVFFDKNTFNLTDEIEIPGAVKFKKNYYFNSVFLTCVFFVFFNNLEPNSLNMAPQA